MSSKRYPEEFKIEAVKQVVDRGHSVSSVATRLDITTHSLYTLIKKYGPDSSTNKEQLDALAEIRRLQKELMLAQWAEEHGVVLEFIRSGKPTQNAFTERFNRTYRTEILYFYLFRTLNEVRKITERWLAEYNSERPHESLNNLTPEEYRLMTETPEISKSGTKTGVLT